MLVLSRFQNESIVIGDDIVVYIVDIRGDKVRVGVEAPRHIPVHRNEVYEAIQRYGGVEKMIKPKLLTPLDLAERLLNSSGDGQAVLVITGAFDFVRHCKSLVDQVDRAGHNVQILAIGLDPQTEGTESNESAA